jgi:hypothetical protein
MNDTSSIDGKFAAGLVDTSGKFTTSVMTPMANLDLEISPRIFEKIQNDPDAIIRLQNSIPLQV